MNKLLKINAGNVILEGSLDFQRNSKGLVLFSHGSGSSRFSPRNNFVAQHLQSIGLGTFLFDLLTKDEDQDYHMRFNIPLLSRRLVLATRSLIKEKELKNTPIGYFGASTGAASALIAASELGTKKVQAVVSRGGRPDLAMDHLPGVKASTLLIVGELDTEVLQLNRQAFEKLAGKKMLRIIKEATHLFEEPGALEQVAELTGNWFIENLKTPNVRKQKSVYKTE